MFYKYLKGVYQVVIQKTLSSWLEAFLIESVPYGVNRKLNQHEFCQKRSAKNFPYFLNKIYEKEFY